MRDSLFFILMVDKIRIDSTNPRDLYFMLKLASFYKHASGFTSSNLSLAVITGTGGWPGKFIKHY